MKENGMKHRTVIHFLVMCLLTCFFGTALAFQKTLPPKYDEADLKKRYDALLIQLDYVKVAADHPKVIKDLLSGDSAKQVTAVKMLGEAGDPTVIPWLVPFLDSEDTSLRIWAGSSIDNVIATCALKHRDFTRPDQVILQPQGDGEMDLRPFAWIALKMFRKPDDGNTHAYAASVIRYLEVREFEDELRRCLQSTHPAVSEKAKWALQSLGFNKPAPEKQAQSDNAMTPLICRHAESGILFLVESDRHHVVAVDKDGKILWTRQPATDGKLPPYSETRPCPNPAITWIGASTVPRPNSVGISFNSRQAGALDLKTGDFTFLGQD